jgi:hypothetical protein
MCRHSVNTADGLNALQHTGAKHTHRKCLPKGANLNKNNIYLHKAAMVEKEVNSHLMVAFSFTLKVF